MKRSAKSVLQIFAMTTDWIPAQLVLELQAILSDVEIARAKRLRQNTDRRDYIVAHAILRLSLSRHLNCEPVTLRFELEEFGRPVLASPGSPVPPRFSLSHTRGCVGVAISTVGHCGLDIERYHGVDEIENLAPTFLSSGEQAFVHALDVVERRKTIVQLWTLKEALMKARGTGLSDSPNDIEFQIRQDRISLHSRAFDSRHWEYISYPYAGENHLSFCYKAGQTAISQNDARELLTEFFR